MAGVVIFKSILGVGGFRLLWEGGGVKTKETPTFPPTVKEMLMMNISNCSTIWGTIDN